MLTRIQGLKVVARTRRAQRARCEPRVAGRWGALPLYRRGGRTVRLLAALTLAAGCSSRPSGPEPALGRPDERSTKSRVELHILATSHEGKDLASGAEAAAARLLGHWRERESKCSSRADCATLSVSAGDHGAAESTAAAQLGYVASAVGRTDASAGLAALERSRIPYVAEPRAGAAARTTSKGDKVAVGPAPAVRLQREGLTLEILGLSSTSPASRDPEQLFGYLNEWALGLQNRNVDAGIVLSDRCLSELVTPVERAGRTWPYLLLVIGQACGEPVSSQIYSIAMLPAGEGLTSYGRAKLTFDRGSRALLQAVTSLVDITAADGDPGFQANLGPRPSEGATPQPPAAP